MTHRWFRAKRYGWGWTPASVEGWLVLGLFVLGVAADVFVLRHRLFAVGHEAALIGFFAVLAALVGVLLGVCWVTGERPRWHWGD